MLLVIFTGASGVVAFRLIVPVPVCCPGLEIGRIRGVDCGGDGFMVRAGDPAADRTDGTGEQSSGHSCDVGALPLSRHREDSPPARSHRGRNQHHPPQPAPRRWRINRPKGPDDPLPAPVSTTERRDSNPSLMKITNSIHRVCQSRLVVNRVVPRSGSTSLRSVSVNPTLARTRREAVFQSQTVAHRRSCPDDLAQSRTTNEASVAYP